MTICDAHLLQPPPSDARAAEEEFAQRVKQTHTEASKAWGGMADTFLPSAPDLAYLPDGSWMLELNFKLRKPFTSKGQFEFHEVQNPIARDHLTGLPIVHPTTWKGHLKFATGQGVAHDRLFGFIRGVEGGQAGRLQFFPTLFTAKLGREVVTPLARDTRTPAPGPLGFEVIPPGSEGRLLLLYLPRPKGEGSEVRQIGEDLEAIALGIGAMLLDYGFSAKKTSGWGVVDDQLVSGLFAAKGAYWPTGSTSGRQERFAEPDEAFKNYMDDQGKPLPALKDASSVWLSKKAYQVIPSYSNDAGRFKAFCRWYDQHGEEWSRRIPQDSPGAAALQRYEFSKVSDFVALASGLAVSLKESWGG